ncbi:hypothetical protein SLEP1_g21620 [Rubroshorea leprosula]|uniref:EF-hand domain-containing protein n=1 Tax=Rubroshorea leprosula TaxID=152421 RepID=A0AAV5JFT0_9ROSI|nr:hypothetical protein SLEP1_g21620 [Rubroshorea leprosula]
MQASWDHYSDDNDDPFLPKCLDKSLCKGILGATLNHKKQGPVLAFTEEELRNVFRRYDADGDSHLNKQELKNAFTSLGSRFPGFRASLALLHADKNRNGLIDQTEFETLVKYTFKRGYKYR